MNNTPVQREYFFDSIRAWLMLLGIPFHISLIYSSHSWHVNSAEPTRLGMISYAVFCLKKKHTSTTNFRTMSIMQI